MNTPRKNEKGKGKEGKSGLQHINDECSSNNNNNRNTVIKGSSSNKPKTIILNYNSNSNNESNKVKLKCNTGRNSPLFNHSSVNTEFNTKHIKSIKKQNTTTTTALINKSPIIKKTTNKITNVSLNTNTTTTNNTKVKVKLIPKSPRLTEPSKTIYKNRYEHSKLTFQQHPKHPTSITPGHSISPKPSSPTEMHNELKPNGKIILKTEHNNQSLMYSIKKPNHIYESPFNDKDKTHLTTNKKKYIKRTINNNRPTTPIPSSKTVSKVKGVKRNNKDNGSNNNNNNNSSLNKSFDCRDRAMCVFDSTDNIFEYVNNTIIVEPKKNKKKNKNRVIQQNEWRYKPNDGDNIENDDLVIKGENGMRYTGKFNKNIFNYNNNEELIVERFSFKNHFVP
jgi:hypothetical protein